jgi:hypothetical protein
MAILYFPNIVWEAVRVEGLWEESVAYLKCDGDVCKGRQEDPTHIPEYLFAEIEQAVLKDLGAVCTNALLNYPMIKCHL